MSIDQVRINSPGREVRLEWLRGGRDKVLNRSKLMCQARRGALELAGGEPVLAIRRRKA
jgi:hypothetical protein